MDLILIVTSPYTTSKRGVLGRSSEVVSGELGSGEMVASKIVLGLVRIKKKNGRGV